MSVRRGLFGKFHMMRHLTGMTTREEHSQLASNPWCVLTNRPATDLQAAQQLIQWYT